MSERAGLPFRGGRLPAAPELADRRAGRGVALLWSLALITGAAATQSLAQTPPQSQPLAQVPAQSTAHTSIAHTSASHTPVLLPEMPDLPPTPAVIRVLAMSSNVRLAHSQLGLELAQQQRLEASPYESFARAGLANRQDPARQYRDIELALERAMRLPAKSRLDRQIGETGVESARHGLVDARHESARLLLRLWFALLRANGEREIWRGQVALMQSQLDAVQGRLRAGDAPRVDVLLAEAALAQALQAASAVDQRLASSRADLATHFPDLATDTPPDLGRPVPLVGGPDDWRLLVLDRNHEILAVRAQREQAELQAQRAQADRLPDPVVGLRYLSERNGAERVLGLTLSVPIPGEYREAGLRSALAQADIRAEREQAALRRIAGEAVAQYRLATGSLETWTRAKLAAERLVEHAALAGRAYALGEGTLNDVLLARRMANEARLAESSAQADAQEARYRLLLDAHRLWPLDQ